MPDPLPQHHPPLLASRRTRRGLLLTAAAIAAGGTARATPAPLPEEATLLIAGPSQGATAAWADVLVPALAQALPAAIHLARESVGGIDGVTAANQFEARLAPDGGTALLLPGMAALAWLVGDPRARFNAAQWVTVLAGTTPAVLASRLPLARLTAGQIVRVEGNPASAALPALLAVELLGALPQAVPARPDHADADAVVLHGRELAGQVEEVAQAGFQPILALRDFDPGGQTGRDPDFPELPILGERLAPTPRQPLAAALGAAAAAVRLDTALVLRPLTSASMVALWRRACAQAAAAPATQALAAQLGIHPDIDAAAVASTAPLAAVDAAVMLDLRRWLAQRFGWHPA
jgi:hypothetical protein